MQRESAISSQHCLHLHEKKMSYHLLFCQKMMTMMIMINRELSLKHEIAIFSQLSVLLLETVKEQVSLCRHTMFSNCPVHKIWFKSHLHDERSCIAGWWACNIVLHKDKIQNYYLNPELYATVVCRTTKQTE